ncbi:efflux RND transporter periplasmic adaptor subunit [Bryobacter aggregatus]|uniref:efflux RND transporter periplasmic adaptor subunit n=1 Tax=Bryobacter aggregatus TaxID=360054 RepID=UPI00068B29A0|nr:efflux RND transporter periplasmic adaptor subunit [Bryobacter aggregatus]
MRLPFSTLTLASTAALALFLTACNQQAATTPGKGAGKKGGDVPVVITKAVTKDVPLDLDVIGNVEASSTVTIKPQVSGELKAALFKEGEFVTAGSPLFEIDRRTITAQLDQAIANLARSEAQLRQATATLAKDVAQAEYLNSVSKRNEELMREGIVSKEVGAQAQSQAQAQKEATDADRAAIESSRADIAANKATIDNLKVQLSFTTIKAPITGRTGTLLVKPGNIVSANTTELVSIVQIQPLNVTFAVPESQFQKIANRFGKEKIPVTATPQDTATSSPDAHQGVLIFIENTVDSTTGTLRLRASFPNQDRKMWPGQFVRVRMRLGTLENAVVVPNQAIQTGQDGSYIYVVKEDRTVENRPVTTGQRNGNEIVITKGINAGETIVTEGQLRIAPGLKVTPRPAAGGGGGRKGEAKGAENSGGGENKGGGRPKKAE